MCPSRVTRIAGTVRVGAVERALRGLVPLGGLRLGRKPWPANDRYLQHDGWTGGILYNGRRLLARRGR